MKVLKYVDGRIAKKIEGKFHDAQDEEVFEAYVLYYMLRLLNTIPADPVTFISVILAIGLQESPALLTCFSSGPINMESLYKNRTTIHFMMNLVRTTYLSSADKQDIIKYFFEYPNGLFRRSDFDYLAYFQKNYRDYEYLAQRLSLNSFMEFCTNQQTDLLKEYIDSPKEFIKVVTYASQNNVSLQFTYEGKKRKVSPICCIRFDFRRELHLLGIESVSGVVEKYAFAAIENLHLCSTEPDDYTWQDLNNRVIGESFMSTANWALIIPTGKIKGLTGNEINSIECVSTLIRLSYWETGHYGIEQAIIAGEKLCFHIYKKGLYKGLPDAIIHLLRILYKTRSKETREEKNKKKVTRRRSKKRVFYHGHPKSHRKEQFRIRKNHGNIKEYWRSVEEVTNPDVEHYNIKWNKKRDKARITELHFDSFDSYFTRGSTGWKDNGHHFRYQWEPEERRRAHREIKRENICLSGIVDKESFVEEFSDDDITYMLLEECYFRESC